MKRSVIYATKVAVPYKHAQSIQIEKMFRAMDRKFGDKALLFSGSSGGSSSDFQHVSFRIKSRFDHIRFLIRYVRLLLVQGSEKIFTRDVDLAFLALIFSRAEVFLELHHEYERSLSKKLFSVVKRAKRMRLVFISDALRHYFVQQHELPESQIVVHDACDRLEDLPETVAIPSETANKMGAASSVVHCGKFSESKGGKTFVELADLNPNFLFVQIGDALAETDKAILAEAADLDNFLHIPQVAPEEVQGYLDKADVLFFPMTKSNKYWWCTSPLKLFDYIQSGKPIVGNIIGSSAEIDLGPGFFEFNANDNASARAALAAALQLDEDEKERIRVHGQEMAIHHNWDTRVVSILGT